MDTISKQVWGPQHGSRRYRMNTEDRSSTKYANGSLISDCMSHHPEPFFLVSFERYLRQALVFHTDYALFVLASLRELIYCVLVKVPTEVRVTYHNSLKPYKYLVQWAHDSTPQVTSPPSNAVQCLCFGLVIKHGFTGSRNHSR